MTGIAPSTMRVRAVKASSPDWAGDDKFAQAGVLGWYAEVEHIADAGLSTPGWYAHVRYAGSDDWHRIAGPCDSMDEAKEAADAWFVQQALAWAGIEVQS